MTVTLFASDLASKWGFEDGDILSELVPYGVEDHPVLIYLVRKYLIPLLPEGVEVEEIGTCHNPIRATRAWREFCEDSDVEVEITEAMVQEALNVGQ